MCVSSVASDTMVGQSEQRGARGCIFVFEYISKVVELGA